MATIRFTKKRGGAGVLSVVRDDGSVAVFRSKHGVFFASHDLMHYAVETTLGLGRAFFGLIAAGAEVQDFGDRASDVRRNLPAEAVYAEHIVGLLHLMWTTEGPASLAADDAVQRVRAELDRAAEGLAGPPPGVDRAMLDEAARRYADLLARWAAVPPGEALELEW